MPPLATRIGTAALAAVLCGAFGAVDAAAQADPRTDTPSVGVAPNESRPEDPNSGQWFVFRLGPGGRKDAQARVANPANVPQVVKLYLRDLSFGADGTPVVDEPGQQDVGAWGHFPRSEVTIPPRTTVLVGFGVSVPVDAEPGDHVGVLVAENSPLGRDIKVIRRVATRLYVTVPGDATRAFEIIGVDRHVDSRWFPSKLSVDVLLRNTGRVRITPAVKVGGMPGTGPELLLARSVEPYSADVRIPWYGGRVDVPVEVVAEAGPRRTAGGSVFVVPWGIIVSAFLGALAVWVVVRLLSRRTGRLRRLQAEVHRLQQVLDHSPAGGNAGR